MKCKYYAERYLKASRSGTIPFPVRLHMVFCSRCRNEVNVFQEIQNSLLQDGPAEMPAGKDLCSSVMKQINLMPQHQVPQVSFTKWTAAGLMILAGIFLIPFNPSMQWARNYFGDMFDVSLTLVLGLVLSIYCTVFAATHLKPLDLKGKINRMFLQ